MTNTGGSVISGDVGVSPGTSVTGFPPGVVNNGTIHANDGVAQQAQIDLTTAYNDAAGRTPETISGVELGSRTLTEGVYANPTLGLNGPLTLDAQNNPDAVFVFKAGSTLITGAGSSVVLTNGADPCNVYWQVGSSATMGANTAFIGTVMAQVSITLGNSASVDGRVLARTAAVTLDTNRISLPVCAPPSPTPSASSTPTPSPTPGPSATIGTPTSTPTDGGPTIGPSGTGGGGGGGGGGNGGGGGGGNGGGGGGGGNDDGGGGGSGNDDGGGGGGGGDTTPVIPDGNPDTGVVDAGSSSALAWWGLLALGGSVASGTVAIRRSRRGVVQR